MHRRSHASSPAARAASLVRVVSLAGLATLTTLAFGARTLARTADSLPSGQAASRPQARPEAAPVEATPQPRPHGSRISVSPSLVEIDDGDTAVIHWSRDDAETVRILGIDTPETRHPEHNLPYAQPFGPEARAFGQGAFAAASRVELLRSATLDPYGRTLGYLFVNGRNYSALVVRARLAYESVSFYGDNGLPAEAAEVLAAAKEAGPLPFEPPHVFRGRMRDVSDWMRMKGTYPEQ